MKYMIINKKSGEVIKISDAEGVSIFLLGMSVADYYVINIQTEQLFTYKKDFNTTDFNSISNILLNAENKNLL